MLFVMGTAQKKRVRATAVSYGVLTNNLPSSFRIFSDGVPGSNLYLHGKWDLGTENQFDLRMTKTAFIRATGCIYPIPNATGNGCTLCSTLN